MNPFLYGNIVSGEYFYDRAEELLQIKQTIIGGNNLVLYARRRYGKSSLVKKILNELQQEGYVTIYLDFMAVLSQQSFIENYAKEIFKANSNVADVFIRKVAKLVRGFSPALNFDSFGNPSFSLSWMSGNNNQETLSDIIDLPNKIATNNKKWIIAFDEFQEITRLNGNSFENILRSHIQHHQNVSYLFFGSRTHLLQDMFNNKNKAFYNAAKLMQLNSIGIEETIRFLKQRFGKNNIEISEDNCRLLIKNAGNIPYYIQFLAAEVWQFAISEGKEVNEKMISKSSERILNNKSDFYWELINNQTNNRKKILIALCHFSEGLFSEKVNKQFDLGPASSIQKAIDSFISQGIIDRYSNKYIFCDPFFKLFIINNL